VPRSPEQITDHLAAAAERRRTLHHELVTGVITVERYRDCMGVVEAKTDRLLQELSDAR
jgi:hypothetical protein